MKNILMERMNCSERMAALIENRLAGLEESLRPALEAWLLDGSVQDAVVEEYSLKGLMEEKGLTFTGALLTLDGLIKQPELTRKAIAAGIK